MRLISRSYYIEPMQSTQTTWLSLDSWLPAHFRQTEDHWQAVQARVLTLLLLLYIACFIPVGIIAGLSALYGVPNTGELFQQIFGKVLQRPAEALGTVCFLFYVNHEVAQQNPSLSVDFRR